MFYILLSLLLFCASVAVHVYFCRRTTQSGLHAKAYLIIAGVMVAAYALVVWMAAQGHWFGPQSFWGWPFQITAILIFILMVPVYISFYALTQLMSPSKKILLTVHAQGRLDYAQIMACVEEEDFIGTRIKDLVISGCAKDVGNKYVLSLSGRQMAVVLDLMQKFLGRPMGG